MDYEIGYVLLYICIKIWSQLPKWAFTTRDIPPSVELDLVWKAIT